MFYNFKFFKNSFKNSKLSWWKSRIVIFIKTSNGHFDQSIINVRTFKLKTECLNDLKSPQIVTIEIFNQNIIYRVCHSDEKFLFLSEKFGSMT